MSDLPALFSLSIALSALTGCPQKPSPVAPDPHDKGVPPLGIARSGDFPCEGEITWSSLDTQCASRPPSMDKPPEAPSDGAFGPDTHYPTHPPPPEGSCRPQLIACHHHITNEHANQVIACRGQDGELDGPLEVIATDGSVLENGYCAAGHLVGPWARWRAGRLDSVVGHGKDGLLDILFTPEGYQYKDPVQGGG